MSYTLLISPKLLKKLNELDKEIKERITDKINEILNNPERFKPLRYELKGLRSARAGKWRIVYRIEGDEIIILSIAPRKNVYEEL